MRIAPARCPECGDVPEGTVENIPGVALMRELDDGSFEYTGRTRVSWDEQSSVTLDDHVFVQCPRGHEWAAKRQEVSTLGPA